MSSLKDIVSQIYILILEFSMRHLWLTENDPKNLKTGLLLHKEAKQKNGNIS